MFDEVSLDTVGTLLQIKLIAPQAMALQEAEDVKVRGRRQEVMGVCL